MTWRSTVAEAVGAEVVATETLQSLWSGYGELVRARLDGPPGTVIVKRVAPPDGTGVGHARKLRSYDVETAFYRLHADRSPVRVARSFRADRDDEGWLLVLEDLDGAGFAGRRSYGDGLEPAAISACLTWLAKFHAHFLGESPEGLWPEGAYWHLETRPDELAAMAPGPLRREAARLDAVLRGAAHRTLIHGDAKPANFCFGDGEVAAVDFQYVGGGVGVKDVAYFLGGALREPALSREAEGFRDHYFDVLRDALGPSRGGPVEDEWRALWAVAWADFERFLAGWAPDHWKRSTYAEEQVERALRRAGA